MLHSQVTAGQTKPIRTTVEERMVRRRTEEKGKRREKRKEKGWGAKGGGGGWGREKKGNHFDPRSKVTIQIRQVLSMGLKESFMFMLC